MSATEAGGAEGSNESVGADGAEEFPVPQASQEDGDDNPAKVEDEAASATEEEDWDDNERSKRCFGSIPTGQSTPGRSIKLSWKTPCLPTNTILVGEIASAPPLS